jgi:hypothetical protein
MAKRDDIPKTDPSEIEALIQRLASQAEERFDQAAQAIDLRACLGQANYQWS